MAQRTWTTRQREVLDLLAAGKTNHEIAVALGITFDGAKWHVSEIMGHLGVDSREDAAEYWRREQGIPSRFARLRRAILGGTVAKVAAGVGVLGLAGVAALVLLNLPGDDDAEPGPTPLTRGENYSYTPALDYLKPDGTVDIVEGDGTVRTANYLDGCDPYSHPGVEGEVASGIKWSMNGDRAFCISEEGPSIRTHWPPGNPDTVDLFPPGECSVGEPAHVFFPTIGFDGERFSCFRGSRGPYAIRDATATYSTVEGGVTSNAWSPAGHHVISQFDLDPAGSSRGGFKWTVVDPQGNTRIVIREAGDRAALLRWTLDGSRAAFSNEDGIHVLETSTWTVRKVAPLNSPGALVHWVLDDSTLLVQGDPLRLIRADDGSDVPIPAELRTLRFPSPNGHLAAGSVPGAKEGTSVVSVVDLRTGDLRTVAGSEFSEGNFDLTWSGDSSRVCWTHGNDAGDGLVVDCAAVDGGPVTRLAVPYQRSYSGLGGVGRWMALSPDLSKVAYALPGLGDSDAAQELWIADIDGRNAVHIGPVDGPVGFEWQPDAVWRPPQTFP